MKDLEDELARVDRLAVEQAQIIARQRAKLQQRGATITPKEVAEIARAAEDIERGDVMWGLRRLDHVMRGVDPAWRDL